MLLLRACCAAGADAINAAADAAEKVTTQVTQLVADLAQGSHDSDAVADAYQQRSPPLPPSPPSPPHTLTYTFCRRLSAEVQKRSQPPPHIQYTSYRRLLAK